MLTCTWSAQTGWSNPAIIPFAPLSLSPMSSALHYATECFEGMKAYRSNRDGKLRLFRPQRNCERMLKSAARVALPAFEPGELRACIEKFVALEGRRWLPRNEPDGTAEGASGSYLYLRPTMIGTGDALGVQKPSEALLFLVAVCFPPLDEPHEANLPQAPNQPTTLPPLAPLAGAVPPTPKTGPASAGMRLLASSSDSIRAWPGGFGNAKVGANYGPSLVAQAHARALGYNQILWLFGDEAYVTEAGGSNFMVIWRTRRQEGGRLQLVTAPLGDGVILEGVTRASVLELVRQRWPCRSLLPPPAAEDTGMDGQATEALEMEVLERRFTMDEIVAASDEGRLLEAFACGTAFFIAPVADIRFRGRDVELPLKSGVPATYAMTIKRWLREIMFGVVLHEWGVVVEEEGS